MDSARILRLMGVDVWRLRPSNPSRTRDDGAVAVAPAPLGTPTERPAPRPPASGVGAAPGPSAVEGPSGRVAAAVAAVEGYRLLCLAMPGVLLLAEVDDPRVVRRLALDLLVALPNGRSAEATEVVFEWPQPGIDPGPTHARKALAAFVEKQIDDCEARTVIVCETVHARAPDVEWGDGTLVIPDLARLAADGSLKRALWRDLRARWR